MQWGWGWGARLTRIIRNCSKGGDESPYIGRRERAEVMELSELGVKRVVELKRGGKGM